MVTSAPGLKTNDFLYTTGVGTTWDSIVSGGASTAEAGGGILGNAAAKLGSMFGKDK
jgi:hypothetical protein